MDQAEPQPLPGQPQRPRPGRPQRRRLRPAPDPAADPAAGTVPDPAAGTVPDPAAGTVPDPAAGTVPTRGQPAGDTDHPVVVGYDGSDSSRHALAYAAGLARRLGRSLLVAYIITPGVFCEPMSGQVIAALRDGGETQRWLLAELDQGCDRAGLDVRIVTRPGRPARELAALAVEFSADALVIGAPSAPWHHIAGSVPAWLTRHAQCPVIVVP
jgi:nucleotide-binding universal stress UspA family protein